MVVKMFYTELGCGCVHPCRLRIRLDENEKIEEAVKIRAPDFFEQRTVATVVHYPLTLRSMQYA